ncbi:MAG: Nif3-like dinuclear metal center hexameric protein [Flavobacteriales bacterium]
MKLKEIIKSLEELAPPMYQESYDNSGLIVGNVELEVRGAIISLDATEEVVQEAIDKGVNLVIAHHPIVFKGLKKFNGSNYVERCIIKAIKHDVAIYAIHTNLDNVRQGVNEKISDLLNLNDKRILAPKPDLLKKMVFFCPADAVQDVKSAIYRAGAGTIGNYDQCSFSVLGEGTFRPLNGANPAKGIIGKLDSSEELRVEIIVERHRVSSAEWALKKAHPYEEVAYEIYDVRNEHSRIGSGMVGTISQEVSLEEFLKMVKTTFKAGCIKYTEFSKPIKTVAVCGGAGGFLLAKAKSAGADVFITSDYKYHEFFDAEGEIAILDIGHYESEQFTKELIMEYVIKKFPKFAAHLTGVNTNPVKYF